ncbi:Alpha-taxilin [Nymphon striatum]|nr:Alpha-taxilin [Nymphon striatum]
MMAKWNNYFYAQCFANVLPSFIIVDNMNSMIYFSMVDTMETQSNVSSSSDSKASTPDVEENKEKNSDGGNKTTTEQSNTTEKVAKVNSEKVIDDSKNHQKSSKNSKNIRASTKKFLESKSLENVTKELSKLPNAEEKLSTLSAKYKDLYNEYFGYMLNSKQNEKKLIVIQKEKESLQADYSKAILHRSKLEDLSRELQRQNRTIKTWSRRKLVMELLKGHVTRKLNSIRHTLTGISDPAFLSDKIIINVEAQLDKLEMSLSKLEYSLNILSDIIPPVDYNTLENEFDVYTSDIDNIRTAIFNLVQAYHKVHAGLEVKSPSLNDTTTPARRFLTTLKPDDLEIDTTLSDFKRWRKQFEDYYYANQMDRMNHAEQRAHLRSCMSLKVQNTVIHLLEVNDAANVVAVLDHLQIYYRAALNIMTRRLHFQQCVQKSGETFSDYLIRLRLLGDNAELDNLSYEDRLASHIVAFIHDRDLQKDLLRMDSHDFKSVKEKCLTWEASNRNQLGMNMFTNSSTAINQISTYKKNKRRIHPLRRDSKIDKHCYRCGVIFNVDHINKCPAKEAICKNCGIKGHFQKVCSRPKYGSDIPVKSHAIQVCVAKSLQERSPPTAEVFVSRSTGISAKIKTTILPDTGATECLVADTVAKKWNIPINRSNIRRIVAANGSELRCLGSMDVRIDWYDCSIVATFFVSPDVSNTVLAWHVLIDLDMIPKEFPLSVRISGRESRSPIHDPDPDDNIIGNTTQVTTDSATTKVIAATQQDSSYQAITSKSYADVTKLRLGAHRQQEESLLRVREEEEKRKEASSKFQTALNDISSMLQENQGQSSKLQEENMEMAKKLKVLYDQYTHREKHVEQLMKHRELETKLTDTKFAKIRAEVSEDKERQMIEKKKLLEEIMALQKKCTSQVTNELVIRTELEAYKEKYVEIQDFMKKNNTIFEDFKKEMNKTSKKIEKLEKETIEWQNRWKASNNKLIKMAEDKNKSDQQLLSSTQKIGKLESLCRALQHERNELRASVSKDTDSEQVQDPCSKEDSATNPIAIIESETTQELSQSSSSQELITEDSTNKSS